MNMLKVLFSDRCRQIANLHRFSRFIFIFFYWFLMKFVMFFSHREVNQKLVHT